MMKSTVCLFAISILLVESLVFAQDFSPGPSEKQLGASMHSAMAEHPAITVGLQEADLIGADNRVLQAAVDYIAGLGGGTVTIGPGEYLMHDSLHLRSGVTVQGTPGETILRKADGYTSPLVLDGDYGEEQVTLRDPEGFDVGAGIAVWDRNANGFHVTVGRITGKRGNTVSVSTPMQADCMVANGAMAATVYPVISGYHVDEVRVENLIIEGNKAANVHLNGCRGAGIFLYRAAGTVITNCTVSNYNGDGISFQQSNDVTVTHCVVHRNAFLGLHPGSGSQRPTIAHCVALENGTDGLFLCWRVRHGLFEHNILEKNGRFGISIGHKDSDNYLRRNLVRSNKSNGIFFRLETLGMAPHRNRLEENVIENNGTEPGTAAIRIRGEVNDLQFANNMIRDTRPSGEQTQTVGILIEETVGPLMIGENTILAATPVVDLR